MLDKESPTNQANPSWENIYWAEEGEGNSEFCENQCVNHGVIRGGGGTWKERNN